MNNRTLNSLVIDTLSLEKISNINQFNDCLRELEEKTYHCLMNYCDEYMKEYVLSLFNDITCRKLNDFYYQINFKSNPIGTINLLYRKAVFFNHNLDKDIFDKNYSLMMNEQYEKIEKLQLDINEFKKQLKKPIILIFIELLKYGIKTNQFHLLKSIKLLKPKMEETIDMKQNEIAQMHKYIERIKIIKEQFFKEQLIIIQKFIKHCDGLGLQISYKNLTGFNSLHIINDYIRKNISD